MPKRPLRGLRRCEGKMPSPPDCRQAGAHATLKRPLRGLKFFFAQFA
jgi:hypothetical protein